MEKYSIRWFSLLAVLCLLATALPRISVKAIDDLVDNKVVSIEPTVQESLTEELEPTTERLETDSQLLRYVDEASFRERKHIQRLTEEEDLSTYVFLNQDGSRTVYYMDEPVKYQASDGTIKEKSLSLSELDNGFATVQNDVQLTLPDDPAIGIRLEYQGNCIALTPQGGSLTKAAVQEDNSVTYPDYFGNGVSLRYTPTLSGLKEDILLSEYTGLHSFTFLLNTGGLELYQSESEYYLAKTDTATQRIELGDIVAFDARGRFSLGTMAVDTLQARQQYRLTISVDPAFLLDENTTYPVMIDPTLTVDYNTYGANAIEDVSIYSGCPNVNGDWVYLHCGYYDDTYKVARTLVRLPGLLRSSAYCVPSDFNITKVEFHIRDASGSGGSVVPLYSNAGNASWVESNATWSNSGAVLGTQYAAASPQYETDTVYDITQLVKNWQSGTCSANAGFILRNSDESISDKALYSAEYSTVSYRPYAVVTYEINSATPTITLNYSSTDVDVGCTRRLTATVYPTGQTVIWTTSNPSIATVDSNGLVNAKKAGAAVITATLPNGTTATCIIYVTIPDGVYRISHSGLFLGTYGSIAENTATRLVAKSSAGPGQLRQLWKIIHLGNGYYVIRPMHKMDMGLRTVSDNVVITTVGSTDSLSEVPLSSRWRISYGTNGYVFYYTGSSSMAMRPADGSFSPGLDIIATSYSSISVFQWGLEKLSSPPIGVLLYNSKTNAIINDNTFTCQWNNQLQFSNLNLVTSVYHPYSTSQSVTWRSSDPNIVSVDASTGIFTIQSPGLVTLTASSYSASGSYNLRIVSDAIYLAYGETGINRHAYIHPTAQYVNTITNNAYASTFTNISQSRGIHLLQNSSLFYIHTHGIQNSILLGQDAITSASLAGVDLENLEFSLLLTCYTGLGGYSPQNIANETPQNIVEQMIICGAETVIGFKDVTYVSDCNGFAPELTRLIIEEKMTVQAAIDKLCDPKSTYYQIASDAVIGGNASKRIG